MVLGWRRAFCTSVHKDKEQDSPIIKEKSDPSRPSPSPKLSSRLSGFFSNPSTPRLNSQPVYSPNLRCKTAVTQPPNDAFPSKSAPQSPKLHCKTRFCHSSAPSSPRSPSTFSLLKSSLGLSKSRCGVCLQSVKAGEASAIFTADCGHSFHYPCIAAHVRKQGSLTCPICNCKWKEMHLLNKIENPLTKSQSQFINTDKRCVLKVYNDDEPLSSPTSGSRFNPIPEFDETGDDEFPGFFAPKIPVEAKTGNVEVSLLSDTAVVSVGKTTESYAVVLKIKAPATSLRRAPIDLVIVLNVSKNITAEKMQHMKKTMRMIVSSLSASDRLSIVAYSSTSKRLLPLLRMTSAGKRAARRIIDAVIAVDSGSTTSATDSIKKAAKVLEDRREVNPASSILHFSDGHRSGPIVSTTRFSNAELTLHSISLSACVHASPEDTVKKSISSLLNVVIQDVKIQLGFSSRSGHGEISGVYSYAGRPKFLGSGSSWCRVDDFYSEEDKELLIELKVQSSFTGPHKMISVHCCYKDPSTQIVQDMVRQIVIPRPRAAGPSTKEIQRLRCLFVTTRAVAESRRMSERNDVASAQHMLSSARALVLQSGAGIGEEFVLGLEAELADLNWKRHDHMQLMQLRQRNNNNEVEEKAEPVTPTSAWRAAERLAKVAMMRKSLNRVSDLHGFENARF